LKLGSDVPVSVATPMSLAIAPPTTGTLVTVFGRGPGGSNCDTTAKKRYYEFSYGTSTFEICPGDSGGPSVYGGHNDSGHVWACNNYTAGSGDIRGDVRRIKEEAMGGIRRSELGSDPHIRRDGVNLSNTSQSSPAACQTLCDNNSSCNSWAYDNSSG